jgi:glycine/D-amino acid oxidase-like deaminating enzyme
MPSAKNTTGSVNIDPGLPQEGPTTSFWQVPLHPLANIASDTLAAYTDVLIIGSGITGCSVAKTLLEQSELFDVTVLEARGLASGASSRNGGHIVSPSFGDFLQLIENFGVEASVEIAEFTLKNVDATFDAVDELGDPELKSVSEIRRTEKVLGFADEETLDKTKKTLELWNKYMPPSRRNAVHIIDAKEAEEQYGLKNVVGAAIGHGAAVWPYRLWTGIWDLLHKRYSDRLHIETFTPVLRVSNSAASSHGARYIVETSRGTIAAAHVVYCTNGFTPHLLPSLQDKMFPVRGTMSVQDLGSFPNHGATRSWSFLSKIDPDLKTGTTNAGLYYLTQNPGTGHMFLGGEHDARENIISADDRTVNPMSAERVVKVLPESFVSVRSEEHKVLSIWSGIMGFSKDGIPLVGQVPDFVTPRSGGQEWIAAGFNGYGTGYCFLCGKAVGEMILGRDTPWLPNAFRVTEKRFYGTLTSSRFWEGLIEPLEDHRQ